MCEITRMHASSARDHARRRAGPDGGARGGDAQRRCRRSRRRSCRRARCTPSVTPDKRVAAPLASAALPSVLWTLAEQREHVASRRARWSGASAWSPNLRRRGRKNGQHLERNADPSHSAERCAEARATRAHPHSQARRGNCTAERERVPTAAPADAKPAQLVRGDSCSATTGGRARRWLGPEGGRASGRQ